MAALASSQKPKVVIGTDHLGADFGDRLRKRFGTTLDIVDCMSDDSRHSCEAEHQAAIADAAVFFGWPSAATVTCGAQLRWIACPGAGVDKIVKEETTRRRADVQLTNAPGTHVVAMAEHVLGSMISLAHRFHEMEAARKRGEWDTQRWNGKICELAGKAVGVFGFGAVGRAVASRAEAFGMEVVASTRDSNLDDVCRRSDFLVVAAPLNQGTRGAVDARRLGLLPRGAVVVVISRGGIVDEEALADALEAGALRGAALDSTAPEPPPKESRLWSLPNVILTPHASALSSELFERRRVIFEENLARFSRGAPLESVVDMATAFS